MSLNQNNQTYLKTLNITAAFLAAVMFVLFPACSGKDKKLAEAIAENDTLPSMKSLGVTTLISDSGITRYKIVAEEWLIHDKKNPPYWAFEKGVYLEKFDTLFRVDASIKADTAYYHEKKKLWELRGHVQILSQRGDKFQTDLLFWDEKKEKVEDIVVELDGIDERIIRLTPTSSNLGSAALSKDGTVLYYQASYESGMNLWKYDLEKGTPTKIGTARGRMKWDGKQGTLYVLGSRFSKMKDGAKSLENIAVSANMVMNLAAEREYMFDHVYRQEKERFYNIKMHGVDWEFLTAEYRKFLPHINNNYDFSELLSEYLGELNVSHTGSGYRVPATKESASTANLGLFFDMSWDKDGLKVDEIVAGGPFDKASSKLQPGDIITSINGVEIKKGMDFYHLLDRQAGVRTLIGIKKSTGEQTEMVVRPITESAFTSLLYKRWVKQNAQKVAELSGGRLGYVHIESMDDASFRTIYSDILGRYNNCDGIVIDTRFNGGGRLHEDIEVLFSGEKYLTQEIRGKDACDMPSRRYNKASIMLMGEANYSNAHGTPWVYKHKNMGLLVGKPVPGTMTSVTWENLQDATVYFGIPVVGYRKADGTYLENDQLNPDIDVENTKELVVKGRDEQLEAAVKALLQQIDTKQ